MVVSDTSIRNNVTTSVAPVHLFKRSLKKTLHYTINVTTTEVELFVIRCEINQATQIPDTSYIIIITDTLYVI